MKQRVVDIVHNLNKVELLRLEYSESTRSLMQQQLIIRPFCMSHAKFFLYFRGGWAV